jgi:hypothetical protein
VGAGNTDGPATVWGGARRAAVTTGPDRARVTAVTASATGRVDRRARRAGTAVTRRPLFAARTTGPAVTVLAGLTV